MLTTQRNMKAPVAVTAAGFILALGFSSTVSAVAILEEVTQLIHFDDTNNGASTYTTADGNFYFSPTNFQSSIQCADDTNPPGNGSCLIESNQGVLPEMTRLTGDNSFSLDSFYFLLTGNGTGSSNAITVTGTATETYHLGGIFSNITSYDTGLAAGALVKNTGYIADMSGFAAFNGIDSIQFGAASSAQVRLDCIVTTFYGETEEAASGFTNGCGGSSVSVPEPGTLALLGLGLLGLATARRGA